MVIYIQIMRNGHQETNERGRVRPEHEVGDVASLRAKAPGYFGLRLAVPVIIINYVALYRESN